MYSLAEGLPQVRPVSRSGYSREPLNNLLYLSKHPAPQEPDVPVAVQLQRQQARQPEVQRVLARDIRKILISNRHFLLHPTLQEYRLQSVSTSIGTGAFHFTFSFLRFDIVIPMVSCRHSYGMTSSFRRFHVVIPMVSHAHSNALTKARRFPLKHFSREQTNINIPHILVSKEQNGYKQEGANPTMG